MFRLPRWYEFRLRVFETNYGRHMGWYVMRECKRLAELTDCRWEEMFWDSYLVTPLTDDPRLNQSLLTDYWNSPEAEGTYFLCREFPEYGISFYLPAADPTREPGRVILRGLYAMPFFAMPWDYLILWWRRFRRRRKNSASR
jgi:hypothetical protein